MHPLRAGIVDDYLRTSGLERRNVNARLVRIKPEFSVGQNELSQSTGPRARLNDVHRRCSTHSDDHSRDRLAARVDNDYSQDSRTQLTPQRDSW